MTSETNCLKIAKQALREGAPERPDDPALRLARAALAPAAVRPVRKYAQTTVPIMGSEPQKQLVYCVAVAPHSVDTQGEHMTPEDIEEAAHRFLTHSRIVKSMHATRIPAVPVESYIAPQDLHFADPTHGEQHVPKGSWVMALKVNDPDEWAKVTSGFYTGISVGGFGVRL